jgi:hypothetical protein
VSPGGSGPALSIEDIGIVDLGAGEEERCREFVRFFSACLEMQTIAHAALGQMIRFEPVVDHSRIERNRLCIRSDCGERRQMFRKL